MQALSFKDARIFRYLCYGTGLRTDQTAITRRGERRKGLGTYDRYSERVTFISSEQPFKGHVASYGHRRSTCASFCIFFSRDVSPCYLVTWKKRQYLDRDIWVTCARFAVRFTAERCEMKEGSCIEDFSLRSTVNKLIKMINKIETLSINIIR